MPYEKLNLKDEMVLTEEHLAHFEEGIAHAVEKSEEAVSIEHEWNGTVLTVRSNSGKSSADLKGKDGKDGTSVTVSSVSESDADGGSNVVTFSDGKTLTIKNGSKGGDGATGAKGTDGYSPVRGVDYWTNADIEEMENQNINFISEELSKRGQMKPEFANSIDECIDTTKLYVLPDGYIYAYMTTTTEGKAYTNLADPTSDDWKTDYRISSSGLSAQTGKTTTNAIPCKLNDVVRIKGVTFVDNADRYGSWYADGAFYGNGTDYVSRGSTTDVGINKLADDYYEFTVLHSKIGLMRFAFTTPADPSVVIVTVNEEIVESGSTTTEAWTSTGHAFVPADYEDRIVELENDTAKNTNDINKMQSNIDDLEETVANIGQTKIPEYWVNHLEEKIDTIKALQATSGRGCFSFVFMTDTHYPSNLGKCSPLLAKKIMDECNIKYAVHGGDAQTRGCHDTKEALLEENKSIEEMFAPIRNRMLFVEGNHDGAYSTVNGVTYAKQLNDAEMYEEYFRRVGFVGDVHFCDDANAYYVDDVANKVRYICLDTHCVPDDVNGDGTAVYNKFRSLNFTQSQFDFLTGEALVNGMTDKWNVIVIGHVYIHEKQNDLGIMVDLLSAYQNKTEYSGTYAGVNGFDAVSVNADFTNAKGTLVGYFCGHKHVDAVYQASNVKVIITRCDANEENDATLNSERVKGTTTEQSFDVFTVNTKTRKIYATKIGAGEDREIGY